MDIINGLHGIGVALAFAAAATLVALCLAAAEKGTPPRHSAKIIVAALSAAIIAGFLIGATS